MRRAVGRSHGRAATPVHARGATPARACGAAAVAAALAACAPALEDPGAVLSAPTILAVIAEPAEVRPGHAARYRAVIGGPEGAVTDAPLSWSLCTSPRPLAEPGPVDPACLSGEATALGARGAVATATIPADACRRFGPDPPPGDFRAQDPDATGGYYQPLLVRGLEPDVVFTHRLRCGWARVPVDVARQAEADYRDNRAPEVTALVRDGAAVRLTLAPTSFETYAVVEPGGDRVTARAERLTVSWWTSGGALAAARLEAESVQVDNEWEAAPGATLWAVVRDDRGAAAVATVTAP